MFDNSPSTSTAGLSSMDGLAVGCDLQKMLCRTTKALNFRVTAASAQGERKYMEDRICVHFEEDNRGNTLFSYFGVFDGHGGPYAAAFARDKLLAELRLQKAFTGNGVNRTEMKTALRTAFLNTHNAMWNELSTWPKTNVGRVSTAGTTVTVAVVKGDTLVIGHVGDSGLVLGTWHEGDLQTGKTVHAKKLTQDHKPNSPAEKLRIESAGGSVALKAGVPRVVWKRARLNHTGPITRSTEFEFVPFLAVARSLGDLWSYSDETKSYAVSPEPDISTFTLYPDVDRCLVLASDGLWNMLLPHESIVSVESSETKLMAHVVFDPRYTEDYYLNPAAILLRLALSKWRMHNLRSDNISVLVVMLDPPGMSKLEKWRERRRECGISRASKWGIPESLRRRLNLTPETSDSELSSDEEDMATRDTVYQKHYAFRRDRAVSNRAFHNGPTSYSSTDNNEHGLIQQPIGPHSYRNTKPREPTGTSFANKRSAIDGIWRPHMHATRQSSGAGASKAIANVGETTESIGSRVAALHASFNSPSEKPSRKFAANPSESTSSDVSVNLHAIPVVEGLSQSSRSISLRNVPTPASSAFANAGASKQKPVFDQRHATNVVSLADESKRRNLRNSWVSRGGRGVSSVTRHIWNLRARNKAQEQSRRTPRRTFIPPRKRLVHSQQRLSSSDPATSESARKTILGKRRRSIDWAKSRDRKRPATTPTAAPPRRSASV